jgi:hypothetical protein
MKNKMIFFSPDDGGESIAGSGGEVSHGDAVFDTSPKQTTGEPQPPSGPGPTAAGTPSEPPGTPPAESGFDAAKFAKEFGDTLGQRLEPLLKRQDQPQMTQEEARKLLRVWQPDDNWYAQYDNLETRKDAVASMRDALVLQADTLAQLRMREMFDQFKNEFGPHIQAFQSFADQQRDERFLSSYPQFREPGLQPLVRAVADDLAKQKQVFKTEEEAFTALAKGVEAVMKVNNPNFKLDPAGQPAGTNNQGRGRTPIPTMTPGAGGGTGRSQGGQQQPKPRGLAVFDK